MERGAPGQGEQLHAVADTQHRQLARESGVEQRPVEAELPLGHRIEADRRGVRPIRGEVVAAGQQQAIEAPDPRLGGPVLGDVNRLPPHFVDRAGVRGVDVVVGASRLPAAAFIETWRNADERPHAAKYTLAPRTARRGWGESMARILIAGCGYVGGRRSV